LIGKVDEEGDGAEDDGGLEKGVKELKVEG